MFGLSLAKIALTMVAVLAAWQGFRWWARVQASRSDRLAGRTADPLTRRPGRLGAGAGIEDLVACPICKTYVARSGGRSCGRDDCPFPT